MNLNLHLVKKIVLVASGKGGVGKSTVAANLAAGLSRRGLAIGLLDADFSGPSIPTMFGVTGRPKVINRLIEPIERYGVKLLSAGLLADPAKAFVWRGPLLRGVLKQLLRDTNWGDLDCLIIDLPPGTGEVQITVLGMVDVFGAIVVTTPQDVVQADVRRCLSMFRTLGIPILSLVENMSVYTCPHCGTLTKIFPGNSGSKLSVEFDIGHLVYLPFESSVATSGDVGKPLSASPHSELKEFKVGLDQLAQLVCPY